MAKFIFRSDVAKDAVSDEVESKRKPLAKDLQTLVAELRKNQSATPNPKVQALLEKAQQTQKQASAKTFDQDAANTLATSLKKVAELIEDLEDGDVDGSEARSVSERIAQLNLESLQREQITDLLHAIQANQKKQKESQEQRWKLLDLDKGSHRDLKRGLLYNALGPAGPLFKVWKDTTDEYKAWKAERREADETEARLEKQVAFDEKEAKEEADAKTEKLGKVTEDRFKDVDKRLTALEKGEAGADKDGSLLDRLTGRRRGRGGWLRRRRILLKRRMRLMRRQLRQRWRKLRILSRRKLRLQWRKAQARARALRRTNWLKRLKQTRAVRYLKKLKALKALRAAKVLAKRKFRQGLRLAKKVAKPLVQSTKNVASKFIPALAKSGAAKGAVSAAGKGAAAKGAGLATKFGLKSLAGVSKALPFLGAAVGVYDLATIEEARPDETKMEAGLTYGSAALSGASIGATIGTFIFPAVGTALGGAIGAVGGVAIAAVKRNWTKVKTWLSGKWNTFKEWGAKLWEKTEERAKKFKDFLSKLWDTGAGIIKKLVAWLPGPLSKMLGLGMGSANKANLLGNSKYKTNFKSQGGMGGFGGSSAVSSAVSQVTDWAKNKAGDFAAATSAATSSVKDFAKGFVGMQPGQNTVPKSPTDRKVSAREAKANQMHVDANTGSAVKDAILNSDFSKMFLIHEGKYDSVNRGAAGGYRSGRENLESMTLDQVMAAQANKQFNAAGKYQIIAPTLKSARQALGLTGKEMFNRELQDRIFTDYLLKEKRPALWNYINGGGDRTKAGLAAAQEWASLAAPAGVRTAKGLTSDGSVSYYAGTANNKASASAQEVMSKLDAVRASVAQAKTQTAGRPALAHGGASSTQQTSAKQFVPSVPNKQAMVQPQTLAGRIAQQQSQPTRASQLVTSRLPTRESRLAPTQQADVYSARKQSVFGPTQQQVAKAEYQRVPASTPEVNVAVNQPKQQSVPASRGAESMVHRGAGGRSASLGLRDVPLVLGDNHMVVLNSGMLGAT